MLQAILDFFRYKSPLEVQTEVTKLYRTEWIRPSNYEIRESTLLLYLEEKEKLKSLRKYYIKDTPQNRKGYYHRDGGRLMDWKGRLVDFHTLKRIKK